MSRAQVLILHGHQLAAGHHYAMALIIQRCNELRHQCDTLTSALSTKRGSLTQAQTLLHRLEEVRPFKVSFVVKKCSARLHLFQNNNILKYLYVLV